MSKRKIEIKIEDQRANDLHSRKLELTLNLDPAEPIVPEEQIRISVMSDPGLNLDVVIA